MKILIVNQPLNNRGDESAHKGLIRALIKEISNVEIRVLFVNENQDSINQFAVKSEQVEYINLNAFKGYGRMATHALINERYYLWYLHPTIRKVMHAYKESDWIICAPGGICMGGFQNWNHLYYLKLAQWMGKRLAYYGRSFGPFPIETELNRRFKMISLELLHYFSFLSIRDQKTESLAKTLNLNYVPTVDSAFLDSHRVEIPINVKDLIGDGKYMVFVPNFLIWHYAYRNHITKESVFTFFLALISCIRNKYPDYKIVMLPQTFNFGNYENDDILFFNDLKQIVNSEMIVVIPDIYSSDIQQMIIAGSDFLVGARYHSVVFAINNNIPFIALSYEHKIAGLLTTLGKQDQMIDICHSLESENAIRKAVDLFEKKLTNLQNDEIIQIGAKNIAWNCFHQFIQKLINN